MRVCVGGGLDEQFGQVKGPSVFRCPWCMCVHVCTQARTRVSAALAISVHRCVTLLWLSKHAKA